MTTEELNKLKEEKKESLKNGLIEFLDEYQSVQDNPNSFNRYSKNCGTQARVVAEAFCRYIILSSNKPNGQKKHHAEQEKLRNLLDTVTSTQSSNIYIINEEERKHLKNRLERILDIGNDASHENPIILTQYDLDEIKNNLLYFSEYSFGKEFTKKIITNVNTQKLNKKANNTYQSIIFISSLIIIIGTILYISKDNSSQEIIVKGDTNKITQKIEKTTGSQKMNIEGSKNELIQIKNDFDTNEICQDAILQYQKNIDGLTHELSNTKDDKTKVTITKELEEAKKNMKNFIADCTK